MKVNFYFDYDYLVYINKGETTPENTIDISESLFLEYQEIKEKFDDIQCEIRRLLKNG
jgi:hypothetical protein